MGGPVVDAQRMRASAHVHTQRAPGERRSENALTEIAGEEQTVGSVAAERRETAQLCYADILSLVDDAILERRMRPPP